MRKAKQKPPMRIPRTFTLNGEKILVVIAEDIESTTGNVGEAHFDNRTIILSRKMDGGKMSDMEVFETFVHEFLHLLLYQSGKRKLSRDEDFIEKLEHLVLEFIRTHE